METIITRRSALRSGTIAAIAAGLLGTAGTTTPTAAAEPLALPLALPTTLTPVISTDDLAADVHSLVEEYVEYRDQHLAAAEALMASLNPEQRKLYMEASDAQSNGTSVWHEAVSAEMARHAPGLAPVIRLLWLHVIGEGLASFGACCTPETGYDL